MNEAAPTPDPILTTLREREARLVRELSDSRQALAVAIATAEARLEEVRDLIGTVTRKKPGRKAKAAEVVSEPEAGATTENEGLGL